MNGPLRLRDGEGPAQVLMGGSGLNVPSASRRRALTFVGTAAAGTAVSGTAIATTTASLVKGVALCVCLGTVGGGLASLAVSETFSRVEARRPATIGSTTTQASVRAVSPSAPAARLDPAPPVVAPTAPDPVTTREARGSAPAPGVSGAAAPAVATAASAKPLPGPSLFEEQRSIESARAAVARGDAGSALATLDDHDRAYQKGQFGPEALALRVEALSAAGQLGRARGLAAEFQRRYPHHPLLSRVQGAALGVPSAKH
jgi:hypothetical protein